MFSTSWSIALTDGLRNLVPHSLLQNSLHVCAYMIMHTYTHIGSCKLGIPFFLYFWLWYSEVVIFFFHLMVLPGSASLLYPKHMSCFCEKISWQILQRQKKGLLSLQSQVTLYHGRKVRRWGDWTTIHIQHAWLLMCNPTFPYLYNSDSIKYIYPCKFYTIVRWAVLYLDTKIPRYRWTQEKQRGWMNYPVSVLKSDKPG